MSKIFLRAKYIITSVIYLRKTNASIVTIASYIKGNFQKFSTSKYFSARDKFINDMQEKSFSHDWFSRHIPYWIMTFDKYLRNRNEELKALEIGSFEGRSSIFIVRNIKNVHLTCVDTWEGADEHKETDYIASIEEKFDENIKECKKRITKFKGTSFDYYLSMDNKRAVFDFIYIDGSHHANDVIIDAIKCFELLKVGGVMIFDDYLWNYYPNSQDDPCSAINAFLQMKKGCYTTVFVGYQVHILKIKN